MDRWPIVRLLGWLAFASSVAGCQLIAEIEGQPRPYPCVQDHEAERCELMAEAVLGDVDVDPDRISAVEIVPTPRPSEEIITLGGPPPVNVRVTLDDGTVVSQPLCGGLTTQIS